MIKADIVHRIVIETSISHVQAGSALETIMDSMRKALGRGERIELRGFGVFVVKRRKRGIGRNPKTRREVAIPPHRTVRFKPGKELRDL